MAENAIETYQLTRYFDNRLAVDSLTVSVPQGAVFGFLGPNGAGKTTTVRMLSALIEPSAGTAYVSGYKLGTDDKQIRRNVGVLTELPGLYVKLSAWENLLFFAGLYGIGRRRAAPLAERYLKMLGLWERRSDPVLAYSKGMRQRLAICRALLHQPQVVFLDEPTSGLDPEAARLVRDSIIELRSEGRTIFLSTHNMPEAEALCDLVGIFSTRLLRLDTLEELRGGRHGVGTVVQVQGDARKWLGTVMTMEFVLDASVSDDAHSAVVAPNGRTGENGEQETGTLLVRLNDPYKYTPLLVQSLASAGAPILYVGPLLQTLESIYLELLGRQAGDLEDGAVLPSIG